MVEEYIEQKQYKEALDLLNDLTDEKTRYLRLVCLYGLGELQQAKSEAMNAKVNSKETYYDIIAIYVSILKELEEFEDAINIMIEELSMPYIPYQYESVFNTAYDELLLAKREASEGMEIKNNVFSLDEMENILLKDNPNEDLLYMVIEQMQGINIRRLLLAIREFLKNNNKPAFAKSLLIELMVDQEIDEDMVVIKNNVEYDLNPSYASLVLSQEASEAIMELLINEVENNNPSLFIMCEQFLSFYLYCIYPRYIDESEYSNVAGAIHYHLATLQYIDVELEDIEIAYGCNQEDVLEIVNELKMIEY